jgi:enoyl-CoA hydratase/carnithine racemase
MSKLVARKTPREGVALITLDHPEINNHGSWEAVEALANELAAAREEGTRVSVLASAVPGHWIEHAWLRDLHNMVTGKPASGDGGAWFRALHELAKTPVVTIAAVSGDCSGGGAELGWACDLRIAEESACFGQPEVLIALATGVGGTSRLARLIGRTATAEMVLDGTPMTARRIYELGGVNRVVADGTSTEVALEWAYRLAERPPQSLAVLKQMLIDNDDLSLTDALANEQKLFQTVVIRPEAIERMAQIQERFDAGESPRDVYGEPRD